MDPVPPATCTSSMPKHSTTDKLSKSQQQNNGLYSLFNLKVMIYIISPSCVGREINSG